MVFIDETDIQTWRLIVDINSLKAQIKTGKFDSYYILYGEEHYILKKYIDMIAEKAKLKKLYVDSFGEVFAKISQKSLLNEHFLYVIVDDKDFLTNEKAWSALSKIQDDIVVFQFTSCDKRLKFWKNFQEPGVEFGKLEERILIKYIQKEIDLTEENSKILIDVCEGDLSRIYLEIDKIKKYAEANVTLIRNVDNNAFQTLLDDGTIYKAPKDAIFDFVNAVLDRDIELSFDLLNQSYEVGEANMVLLSVLYNSVRTLLMLQSCKDTKGLGLNGWSVKNVKPYVDAYTNGELVHFMKLIREAEKGIKTGIMPDDISVQSILVQVM